MTYEFQIDNDKYIEGYQNTVRLYFTFGTASTTGKRYTIFANSIHTNLRTKHMNTAGTTNDMITATCEYFYMAPSGQNNYVECKDVFL